MCSNNVKAKDTNYVDFVEARMNNVMTLMAKGTYIQFRVREDIKEDIQRVAELRGLTTSGLIHSLIVKAIREEKERDPQAFRRDQEQRYVTMYPPSLGETVDEPSQQKVEKRRKTG
jgi:hypothetical protein